MFEHIQFLQAAICDRQVGAVVPTSASVVRRVCRRFDSQRPCVMVEYGPGTGAFTRYLLERLHPESQIVAIESNPTFVRVLRSISRKCSSRRPQLQIIEGDAGDVNDVLADLRIQKVDYVLSGIPFSYLDEVRKRELIRATRAVLKPGGELVVYQCSFQLLAVLRSYFSDIASSRCYINFPPLCIMEARKDAVSPLARHQ